MAETFRTFRSFYNTYLKGRFTPKSKRKKKTPDTPDGKMTVGSATPEVVFREFCRVTEFKDTLTKFAELKAVLQVPPEARSVYHASRGRINISEARTVWRSLDKRATGSAYKDGQACAGKSLLVIGAGPCGLRMAIESALLGARTVVVEMRDYVSRNNVLHLWPFVISDLKALGGRVFHSKFCCGSREHASIKAVQQMLLKLALLLGVEVYAPVKFEGIIEPSKDNNGKERGWRGKFSPGCPESLRDFEFDILVGADGKSNTVADFKRKTFRGKLAIAVTANFVNRNSAADNAVEEIGGLFYVFNQPFFDGLRDKADIELENFVYFKDDTHYFVMTARKQSLLKKGVLKRDYGDTQQLLSRENVDRQCLLSYARETAELSTNHQLPDLEFALDHNGKEDVAIFDFTNLHQAENSCMVRERRGKQLLLTIVGDTLIEPFWPTGSGCARGFLSVFDAAWLMKGWAAGDKPVLELLAEREAVLQLLSQTKPDNLNMRLTEYALDPRTRYGPKLGQTKKLKPDQVKHLYDTGTRPPVLPEKPKLPPRDPSRKRAYDGTLNRRRLLEWFKNALEPLSDVIHVSDLTSSWRDGMALLGLVQLYRSGVVDVRKIDPKQAVQNNQKAFDLVLEHFGIAPTISAESLKAGDTPDRLAILSYLTQVQTHLDTSETPVKVTKVPTGRKSALSRKFSSAAMLARLTRRTAKRAKVQETKPDIKRPRVGPLPPTPKTERLSRSATLDKCRGIAAMRIKALQTDGAQPAGGDKVDNTPVSPPPIAVGSSPADICCICRKRLYVSERQNARGHFFHRHCFRCLFCNAALWTHNFHDDKDTEGRVIFLCPDHSPIEEDDSMDGASASSTEDLKKEEPEEMSLEEMAQMVSPDMMGPSGMVGVPQGLTGMAMGGMMMGMAAAFTASAVAEEEDSEDEMSAEAEGMALQEKTPQGDKKKKTRERYYTLATSMRLIVGHEIQREYEEMEDEEQELESRGVQMERSLRNRQSVIDPNIEVSTNEGLVEEWMDVVRQKQEVQDKQSKLVLKAKLLELQERHMRLQKQLQRICQIDDLDEDLEALEALTENLSDEVNDTVSQILELRIFLKQSGESEA